MIDRGWREARRLGRHTVGSNIFRFIHAPCGGRVEFAADMDRVDDSYGPNVHEVTPPHHIWTLTDVTRGGWDMSAPSTAEVTTPVEYPSIALYINGEWSQGAAGRRDDVINPATGKVLGRVPFAEPDDVDRAIAAARDAFPPVARRGPRDPVGHPAPGGRPASASGPTTIGRVMTLEEGKPLTEAAGEVHRAATLLEWDCEEGRRAYGRIIPSDPGRGPVRAPGAGRPGRRLRAVELPGRRPDAQDRRRAVGRLLDRHQAVGGSAGHHQPDHPGASRTPACRRAC